MTGTDLDAVLAQLWAGFADLAATRVEVLEAYATVLSTGRDDPELRSAAAGAAHMLAGALGSYGRQGSDDAAAVEVMLRDATRAPDAEGVRTHVASLRCAVSA
jgi:hypothetical protein